MARESALESLALDVTIARAYLRGSASMER